ncbi:putative reverse transcriptase domain, reverse transcriptase zinc-binding domain protein, partial [Tanacetum coccineum]
MSPLTPPVGMDTQTLEPYKVFAVYTKIHSGVQLHYWWYWGFLKEVLVGFGFHARMIGWIMECVTTTSFSISINGSLHGFFKGKRGIRQGDPLSPYLFTLVMEILTLMLQRR